MYFSIIMLNFRQRANKIIIFAGQSVLFLLVLLFVLFPLVSLFWLTFLTETKGYNFSEEV